MSELHAVPIGDERFSGTDSITVRSPYDGSEIGRIPVCGEAEVDRAVAAGRAALAAGPLPPWQRAEILDKAARLLTERVDEFARIVAEEAAKPIKAARVEARRVASTFIFAAMEARRLSGEVVPVDAVEVGTGKLAFTLRVPIGVVGAITPFNFPLNLVAHKVGPAIASGCPIVLKPATQTPFSALRIADMLLSECGLPPGWLSVVTGPAASVGERIVMHPDVAMITFTGSPEVGWSIRGRAPRKKVSLELGNNSPVIIEPDANWETAAEKIVPAAFSFAGQSCISTQRLLVHESIATPFANALAWHTKQLVIGDPLDEATDVSSLITGKDTERVRSWIEEAEVAGAKVLCGGDVRAGVLAPTVLTNVTPEMKVCSQEVFGPVVGITEYSDLDDAFRIANESRYGLHAGIFTSSYSAAMRATRSLDYGGVFVNEVPTWRAEQMPYGGIRDSGNTREGPAYTVQEMTEPRLVVLHI